MPLVENLRPKVFSTQSQAMAAVLKQPVATSRLRWSSWEGFSQPGSPLYSKERKASKPPWW